MKWVLHQILAIASVTTLIAADASQDPAVMEIRARIAKIELGMARKDAEAVLGSSWEARYTADFASGQTVHYRNPALQSYDLQIRYDWTGNHGIGRHAQPEDPVIGLPLLSKRAIYIQATDAATHIGEFVLLRAKVCQVITRDNGDLVASFGPENCATTLYRVIWSRHNAALLKRAREHLEEGGWFMFRGTLLLSDGVPTILATAETLWDGVPEPPFSTGRTMR